MLTIPLLAHLKNGVYSIRWSIVSDDGHREQGVLAFAVGRGAASPHSVLGASGTLGWNDIALRAHLDGCPSCRAELRELTLVARALASVPVR